MSEKENWEDLPIYGYIWVCETVTEEGKEAGDFAHYEKEGALSCRGHFTLTTPRTVNESLKTMYELQETEKPRKTLDIRDYIYESNAKKLHAIYKKLQSEIEEGKLKEIKDIQERDWRLKSEFNVRERSNEPLRKLTKDEKTKRNEALREYIIGNLDLEIEIDSSGQIRDVYVNGVSLDYNIEDNQIMPHFNVDTKDIFASEITYDGQRRVRLHKSKLEQYINLDESLLLTLVKTIRDSLGDVEGNAKSHGETVDEILFNIDEIEKYSSWTKAPKRFEKVGKEYFERNLQLPL